jgi:hypothetical protein
MKEVAQVESVDDGTEESRCELTEDDTSRRPPTHILCTHRPLHFCMFLTKINTIGGFSILNGGKEGYERGTFTGRLSSG